MCANAPEWPASFGMVTLGAGWLPSRHLPGRLWFVDFSVGDGVGIGSLAVSMCALWISFPTRADQRREQAMTEEGLLRSERADVYRALYVLVENLGRRPHEEWQMIQATVRKVFNGAPKADPVALELAQDGEDELDAGDERFFEAMRLASPALRTAYKTALSAHVRWRLAAGEGSDAPA
jgi:hypothetical protein